ncbi:DnaJ C-terminal domain-containing protein [Paraburkholderia sp. BCC1885]|uniref:DnaJ C-terminal domain-containing protein n=1 Tax=Paraburkholderia sp. BCC1885 TaxID=2562669 RepID=UPI0011823955|nr:DnaJ C-terminal domain-containing protein [Paraburkholderia sp. BCC1885]
MSLEEYYRRLDLPETASQADVKRAYRRLRAKYHPDRNKGREVSVEPVFKRIQEAFEILTGKRKAPLVTASASTAGSERYPDTAAREPRSGPPMRGANCLVELFVPLEAAIHGGEVEVSYAVNGPCRQCQQRGSECAPCYGSGQSVSGRRCSACGGTGRPPATDQCSMCRGSGIGTYRKSEAVKVPAGAWDGQRLVVEGGGHPGANGGPWGDAIFSVVIVCGADFHRDGLNLACEIQVDFVTATLGGSIEVPILGQPLQIAIAPNAHAGSTIRLPKRGLADRNGMRGDLTLQLVLTMPAAASYLSDDERQRLREMFADAERRAMHVAAPR